VTCCYLFGCEKVPAPRELNWEEEEKTNTQAHEEKTPNSSSQHFGKKVANK